MGIFKPGVSSESYAPDLLLAGDFPRMTRSVTLVSGQNLVRGAVLGKITASGKYVLSASAASDGSQTPVAVLMDDCDASGGDKTVGIYESGEFLGTALTLGAGHTLASIRDGLRDLSIYIR
ncbi:bacteriophage lambda head decoration protein D [Azospirillum brasilense]|uniref:Bacteriophage lambda head decoration protein D n=1 Tax=Azospirillum brasilense TaxID=192 RepID=A0A560BUZ9_AZOBR|nr:head decoration protein [Azospirillum brasilense]TWA76441.1 bacteriophage lambda head decoration protein D [Azospirillum brasilense]